LFPLCARAPTCSEGSGWAGPCLIVSLSHPTEDDSDLNVIKVLKKQSRFRSEHDKSFKTTEELLIKTKVNPMVNGKETEQKFIFSVPGGNLISAPRLSASQHCRIEYT
jgi:hypothetical protein